MDKDEIKKRLNKSKQSINEKIVRTNSFNMTYDEYMKSSGEGTSMTREEFNILMSDPSIKTPAMLRAKWESNQYGKPPTPIANTSPVATNKTNPKDTTPQKSAFDYSTATAEERQRVTEFYNKYPESTKTTNEVLQEVRAGKSIDEIYSSKPQTTSPSQPVQVDMRPTTNDVQTADTAKAEFDQYQNQVQNTNLTLEEYKQLKKEGKTLEQIKNSDPAYLKTDEYQQANQEQLQQDASYTRAIHNAELKAKQEQMKLDAHTQNLDKLDQATKARQDAEQKYNESPTDENQAALAEAIERERSAQENVNTSNQEIDAAAKERQEAINEAVRNGELKRTTQTDPPGHEAENEMWLQSNRKKYTNTQTLRASQDDPADRKYINFKQDYVVLVRKKPFYAATAQQRYATTDIYRSYQTQNGTDVSQLRTKIQTKGQKLKDATGRDILPEDNYLRAYQINNFINISINTTVNAPGTCSVTLKGAERVICAENVKQSEFGFYSWSDLAGSWINIDENGAVNDGTGIFYTAGSGLDNEDIQKINLDDYRKNIVSTQDSSNRKEQMGGSKRQTGQLWRQATSNWTAIETGLFNEGQIFRTLFKTREAKYGWRFAEKCDWEPMDEIMIFGKSRTLRVDDVELDDNCRDANGILLGYIHNPIQMFKMEPLFFGYIDSINKTYDANRGCMISINAKDHLKLMEICQACTNAGSAVGRIVPAVNWSKVDNYGTCVFENPVEDIITRADGTKHIGFSLEDFQTKTYQSLDAKAPHYAFLMQNVMHMLYIDEIVQLMGAASGIPEKFLTKRIEPMHRVPPFWQDAINQNLDFFNGQTDSRYTMCQRAAQQIMVEFFADEGGNVVVKIPNWVLGANMLQMNNCNIKYYDDVRYSDLPSFYANEDGTIGVEAPTSSTGLTGSTGGGALGEVMGFINRVFGTILDALGSIFNIKTVGTTLKESQPPPPGKPGTAAKPKESYATQLKQKIADALREIEEIRKREQERLNRAQDNTSELPVNANSVHSSSLDTNDDTINEQVIDYSYANITDNVIEDILNEKSNVIQLDEYRIKVKMQDAHDEKYGSLYSLAKYYYNNIYKWHLIAEINHIHEPTEVIPGQWIIIYFNEPISNYIINSFDENNISNQINELKARRAEKIKQLGLKLEKQDDQSGTIVNQFPFIKGEFISAPASFKNNITLMKKDYLSLQKELNQDKIIHTNSIDSDKIVTANDVNQPFEKENKDKQKQQRINELKQQQQDAETNLQRIKSGKADGSINGNTRFRSSRTDIDIPVIPNEYVISFTLTDSDQEVYNYIEVGGSQAYGILQGDKNLLPSIFRCIPDRDHIMQFGFRQHPVVNCSPLAFDNESAQILGSMLLYRSQCNRYTGVLTCIEDSAIKVGNPVRIYMYDEHPYPITRHFGKRKDSENEEVDESATAVFDEKIFKEQAVFYVESISRNIDVQGVSTMTLQLKAGRVMGMTNAFDILSLFYDLYYREWQSRMYYYNHGGNNTALVNAHEVDIAHQIQEHLDARTASRWVAIEEAEMQRRIDAAQSEIDQLNGEG